MTQLITIDSPIVYREITQYLSSDIPARNFRRNASFETHAWIKHHTDEFAQILFGRPFGNGGAQ